PTAANNSRRPMVTVTRPSRARCVKGRIPRHERAVPRHTARGRASRLKGFIFSRRRVFPKNRCERAASRISAPKIFLQKRLSHKGYPLYGQNHFWTVFVRGGMNKISKWKVPPTGGSSAPQQTLDELGTHSHCCAPRGLTARSVEMRWTVPVA